MNEILAKKVVGRLRMENAKCNQNKSASEKKWTKTLQTQIPSWAHFILLELD